MLRKISSSTPDVHPTLKSTPIIIINSSISSPSTQHLGSACQPHKPNPDLCSLTHPERMRSIKSMSALQQGPYHPVSSKLYLTRGAMRRYNSSRGSRFKDRTKRTNPEAVSPHPKAVVAMRGTCLRKPEFMFW